MNERYGVEERVLRMDHSLGDEDVISQVEAAKLLKVRSSTVTQALDRGRYTIVWDLKRRVRCMLRSEIEVAVAGDSLRRDSRRDMPPARLT